MSDAPKRVGTNELRTALGRFIDNAHFRNEHVVIEKNGEPRAVLVPYSWWQEVTTELERGERQPE